MHFINYQTNNFYSTIDYNGVVTNYFPNGNPFFISPEGHYFYYDTEGNIFYYDSYGNSFYLDDNGNQYYYDEWGNVIYYPQNLNEITNKDSEKKDLNKAIEQVFQKKVLSEIEILKLFNIEYKNPKSKLPFLSDHSIIRFNFNTSYITNLEIASWNLLGRGKRITNQSKTEVNNPWNVIESRNEYIERFQIQINKILEIIKNIDNLAAFLLQEAEFCFAKSYEQQKNNFFDSLDSLNWNVCFKDDKLRNITLYNTNRLISIQNKLELQCLLKKNSILQTLFIEKISNAKISIGNTHLPPGYSFKVPLNYVDRMKQKKGLDNILRIWGGDLNQDLPFYIGDRNFSTTVKKNLKLTRYDYFFCSFPKKLRLNIEEMPTYYFTNSDMKLSNKTSYQLRFNYMSKAIENKKLTKKVEKKAQDKIIDYFHICLCKISEMIAKRLGVEKIFLNFDSTTKIFYFAFMDKKNVKVFLNSISPLKVNYIPNEKKEYQKILLSIDDLKFIFERFLHPDDYSLFFNIEDSFKSLLKSNFFDPYIIYSKREKKHKRQYLL